MSARCQHGTAERGKPSTTHPIGRCLVCARSRSHSDDATPLRRAARTARRRLPAGRARARLSDRRRALRVVYGMSEDQRDAMRCNQIGLCAFCGKPLPAKWTDRNTHVEHDHVTGRVRGIVHGRCNNQDIAVIDRLIAHYGFDQGCPPAMRWYFAPGGLS